MRRERAIIIKHEGAAEGWFPFRQPTKAQEPIRPNVPGFALLLLHLRTTSITSTTRAILLQRSTLHVLTSFEVGQYR